MLKTGLLKMGGDQMSQNVAQRVFLKSKLIHNLYHGKSSPHICATYVIYQSLPKENNHPKGEKFAQSGHPDNKVDSRKYLA
jgi:hypothetical protein